MFEPPAAPLAPQAPPPGRADPIPEERPQGPVFSVPDEKRAQAHADRLKANPGDASLRGYPVDLIPRAQAEIGLAPGSRPAVIVFYADNARASHLQAAELLPLLVRLRDRVDVVVVDVSSAASERWTDAERKLVRRYYLSYVPTTVVLSAERKPVMLQYQRVSAAVVEAAVGTAER